MKYKNKKNGKTYIVEQTVINATNAQNGQVMCFYYAEDDPSNKYVREINEFADKFEVIKESKGKLPNRTGDYGKVECPICWGRIPEPKSWSKVDKFGTRTWKTSKTVAKCPDCGRSWVLDASSVKNDFEQFMPMMVEVNRGKIKGP